MKYLISILTIIFIGCNAKFPELDVSKDYKYKMIINKKYKLIKPLVIHANLVDDYKSKKIWSYSIVSNEFSYGGRYVLWRKNLYIGTSILTKKILKWDGFWVDDFIIIIDIVNNNIYNKVPIEIDSRLTSVDKDGFILMNPEYFKEIK